MSKRYTYSRAVMFDGNQLETFTADQFDSFDEAINAVNKGIYERQLFMEEKAKKTDKKEPVATPEKSPVDTVANVAGLSANPGIGKQDNNVPAPGMR